MPIRYFQPGDYDNTILRKILENLTSLFGGSGASGDALAVTGVAYTASVTVTRPSNVTAYTAGDVVGIADAGTPANPGSAILTLSNIGPASGAVVVDKVELTVGATSVPAGMANFRVHFYDAAPTPILDNAAFDLTSTDQAKHLGSVDLPTPEDLGSVLVTYALPMQSFNTPSGASLFAILETRGGFTPASGTIFTLRVTSKRAA